MPEAHVEKQVDGFSIALDSLDVQAQLVATFDAYVLNNTLVDRDVDVVFPGAFITYSHWAGPTCFYSNESDVVMPANNARPPCPHCVNVDVHNFVRFVQKRHVTLTGPRPPMPCA